MSDGFTSPEELDTFVRETASLLEELGRHEAARELMDIANTAWTTGSEWLGELGLAVRRIKARGDIPAPARSRLDRMMKAARRPWTRS